MKILIVHNRYQDSGGEEIAVANERKLIENAGHKVRFCQISNADIRGVADSLRAGMQVSYSRKARTWMARRVAEFAPDLVHVHNFFPLLTPSIYDACEEAGVPVVQTLHNYRLMCASAMFLRKGQVCEKCLGGSPYWAVFHRCYRNSVFGSLAVAHMIDLHQRLHTWTSKVDLFFALTEFARDKFVEAGLPSERIVVKPNYAPTVCRVHIGHDRRGALYVGRLSEEKGLRYLVNAWQDIPYPLRVAGDGPLRVELERRECPRITFLGQLDSAAIYHEMTRSAFLILPSISYEGFPMSIAEAYACGLPVLASRIGGLPEIVREGVTGYIFEPGDVASLAQAVLEVVTRPKHLHELGENARRIYDEHYSAKAVYDTLIKGYERVAEIAHD